jgi:CRISPR-associated protein Csm5
MIRQIEVNITTLTPLHIGTGKKLTKDFDYVTNKKRTYRIREEALVDELYTSDPKLSEQLMRTPPGQLLRAEDLTVHSKFVRYVLTGEPQGRTFNEQIKDVQDRPYIPGSSLKGALRTVLAWHGWKEKNLNLHSVHIGRNAKFAAQDIEAEIFGGDPRSGRHNPHHDLLRTLRIADSHPSSKETLVIENVKVWSNRGPAAPISVEAIKEETKFTMHASIDEALFSNWAGQANERGFPFSHRDWLIDIPKIARARAAERLHRELSWWKGRPTPSKLREIERSLQNPPEDTFPLQLGFGSGWEQMTIGAPIKADSNWPRAYGDLRLGRIPRTHRSVRYEDFPTSRRVVVRGNDQLMPLGWVWITWREAK